MTTWTIHSLRAGFGRVAAVAAVAATVGLAIPFATDAAPRDRAGIPGCPTNAELVGRINRGLARLVTEGDLTRTEAQEARTTFADWAADNRGVGCEFRDGMIAEGRAFLAYAELTPREIRAAFQDGQSLAAMVEEATGGDVTRDELIAYLTAVIDEGLDAFEADGALTPEFRAAIEERMTEHVPFAVDFEKGDPLPEGHGERR